MGKNTPGRGGRIIELECVACSKKAKLSSVLMSKVSNQACILGRCIHPQIVTLDNEIKIIRGK